MVSHSTVSRLIMLTCSNIECSIANMTLDFSIIGQAITIICTHNSCVQICFIESWKFPFRIKQIRLLMLCCLGGDCRTLMRHEIGVQFMRVIMVLLESVFIHLQRFLVLACLVGFFNKKCANKYYLQWYLTYNSKCSLRVWRQQMGLAIFYRIFL